MTAKAPADSWKQSKVSSQSKRSQQGAFGGTTIEHSLERKSTRFSLAPVRLYSLRRDVLRGPSLSERLLQEASCVFHVANARVMAANSCSPSMALRPSVDCTQVSSRAFVVRHQTHSLELDGFSTQRTTSIGWLASRATVAARGDTVVVFAYGRPPWATLDRSPLRCQPLPCDGPAGTRTRP